MSIVDRIIIYHNFITFLSNSSCLILREYVFFTIYIYFLVDPIIFTDSPIAEFLYILIRVIAKFFCFLQHPLIFFPSSPPPVLRWVYLFVFEWLPGICMRLVKLTKVEILSVVVKRMNGVLFLPYYHRRHRLLLRYPPPPPRFLRLRPQPTSYPHR